MIIIVLLSSVYCIIWSICHVFVEKFLGKIKCDDGVIHVPSCLSMWIHAEAWRSEKKKCWDPIVIVDPIKDT